MNSTVAPSSSTKRMAQRRRKHRGSGSPADPRESLYATLDLHGETAESARRLAEGWLRRQSAAGERTVRLITGRGRRSVGPPVLRGEMEHLLRSLQEDLVERVEVESGGGALRVQLRPPPPPPALPVSLPPSDPLLRRRAEESLAELGIAATPELLAAEMRRLKG